MNEPLRPVAENPFYILGLPPDTGRAEVEREGQKLISMLTVGVGDVVCYETPVGPRERTVEQVRWAMHELRDPHLRCQHALWAVLPAADSRHRVESDQIHFDQGLAAIGWDFRR